MYDSVLVATDGSDDATVAVDHAIELARRLEVPLHGIAVVETRTEYDSDIVDPAVVQTTQRERAEESLAALEARARNADIPVVTVRRTGVPHEEILEYATAYDISTLVIGSRGRSGFRRALLGSTVDAVVRLSQIPVLVVGADDSASEQRHNE